MSDSGACAQGSCAHRNIKEERNWGLSSSSSSSNSAHPLEKPSSTQPSRFDCLSFVS